MSHADSSLSLVLVSVGNSRTRFAAATGTEIEPSVVLENADVNGIADQIAALARPERGERSVLIASVNAPASQSLQAALSKRSITWQQFGRDLPVPIVNALTDDSTVGIDRLLDALGAFHRSKQACVVIDAGTAVTVDFIDGEGTFHGGAIAPGLRMMLAALSDHTAALPLVHLTPDLVPPAQVEFSVDDAPRAESAPFGRDTRTAIAVGVVSAVRGLVHHLIDRYAEFYRGYPRVVATGGDAPLLFENDPLVETIVPDLTLIGMLAAAERLRDIDAVDQE